MDENSPKLSRKKLKALPLILSGRSILDGCEKAGISKSTFYLWMQDITFREEFKKQRKVIIESGLHNLKISIDKAVDVLIGLLDAQSEGVRLRTAQSILEHINKFLETEHLEERITKIEEKLDGKH